MSGPAILFREIHRLRRFEPRPAGANRPRAAAAKDSASQGRASRGSPARGPGSDQTPQGRGPRQGRDAQDDARADRQVSEAAQRGRIEERIRGAAARNPRRPDDVPAAGGGNPQRHRRERGEDGPAAGAGEGSAPGQGRVRQVRGGDAGTSGGPAAASTTRRRSNCKPWRRASRPKSGSSTTATWPPRDTTPWRPSTAAPAPLAIPRSRPSSTTNCSRRCSCLCKSCGRILYLPE